MTPPASRTDPSDPLRTAQSREATLAAWRSSPTRLAEDLAAEDELIHIGYRDRLFTELAANAADAARTAGVSGVLAAWHDGPRLHVANTGAPLTEAGVAALTALRVSPKRAAHDGEVGRFGVGFRATSFADRVEIASTTGSIVFDRERTLAAVYDAGIDARRVPAQRLAWPSATGVSAGYDTEVILHLDDDAQAASLLARLRTEAGDLLLELTALEAIVVDGVTVKLRDADDAYPGRVDVCFDDEVVESWLVAPADTARWMTPMVGTRIEVLDGDVLRSPTVTDVELNLPARVIAALPLTPDRRELHPDADIASAADGYADLVALAPDEQKHLLVPAPSLSGGRVDAALRAAVVDQLTQARWVPTAAGEAIAPERAWVFPGLTAGLGSLLTEVLEPLVHPEVSGRASASTLVRLGARELGLADLADLLGGVREEPEWWARLYEALSVFVSDSRDAGELGALPVPRADGRTHHGARGLFVVDGLADLVAVDWIPVVAPAAYHPLLERIGLAHISLAEVIADPALEQLIDQADDSDDSADELAETVLALLASAENASAPAWLGRLPLPAADGDYWSADELLLPDSPLARVLVDDSPFGEVAAHVVEKYGREPLRRLGCGWGFSLVREALPTEPAHDLPDEEQWWSSLEFPPEELVAVRDLDLVDPRHWPQALTLLADDREIAATLADPDGYTRWWLRRYAEIDSRPLRSLVAPDDVRYPGLFDVLTHPAAAALTPLLAGARPDDTDDAQHWLDALADSGRDIAPGVAARVHAEIVEVWREGRVVAQELEPPEGLRTLAGSVSTDAAVVDAPWWIPVLPAADLVAVAESAGPDGPRAFADLVAADLVSDEALAVVVSAGNTVDPDARESTLLAAATGWELASPLVMHDELTVAVRWRGREHEHSVDRWYDDAGTVHVARPRWATRYGGGTLGSPG